MTKKIVYEQPLNERMRNILRLEYLFAYISYCLKGPAEWDSRAVINCIVEVLNCIDRIDFKAELIKDLNQHTQTLEHWQSTTNVNTEGFDKLLNKTRTVINKLGELEEPLGESLSQHQLIRLVRQRSKISGGACRSDLPGYYHWLQKNPKQRQNELSDWLAPLNPLRDATDLDLYLIRNNAVISQEIATKGFFQSKLDPNAQSQIIQVMMPREHPCYPKIQAGKQRFTIRFFEQPHVEEQAKPTEQNINFKLCCCMI